MKKLLLLVALISVCFSSFLWEFSSSAPITTKPLIYKNSVIFANDNGQVVALDLITGSQRWVANGGKVPTDVILFDGAVVVSSSDGTILKIDQNGKTVWNVNLNSVKYNVSYLYGISANSNTIYASTNTGLVTIDVSGNGKKFTNEGGVLSRPAAGNNFVVYTSNKELKKVNQNGAIEWKTNGEIWKSKALITDNYIFVGTTDGTFSEYQYGSSLPVWTYRANAMIASTPVYNNENVFFADNSGYVYGLDSSGSLKWKTKLSLGVQSELQNGMMAGRAVIFVGDNDQNIYAIDQESGEILWKGAATARVSDPVFYSGTKDEVIFGTADGFVDAYSTEHACSIVAPTDGANSGVKELVVEGKFISTGSATVWVNINGGTWIKADTNQTSWKLYLDPKKSFNPNLNTIQCKVIDLQNGDDGSTDRYTKVSVLYSPDTPAGNIQVTLPTTIVENEPFSLYVNDREDGAQLERVKVSVSGKEYIVDKNLNLTLAAGDYKIAVTKIGYNDVTLNINVSQNGLNPIYVVIGVIVLIVLLYQIWERLLKQRLAKKKTSN